MTNHLQELSYHKVFWLLYILQFLTAIPLYFVQYTLLYTYIGY